MKKIFYIILALMILIPAVPSSFENTDDIIRLHIPANSNLPYDLAIKYSVKEYFVKTQMDKISLCKSKNESLEYIKKNIKTIENDINKYLQNINAPYPCKITVTKEFHPKNNFKSPQLPEGTYSTVRILLGNAVGKNVFFVMHPSLSIKDGVTIKVDGKESIRYKSKLFEIIKGVCR